MKNSIENNIEFLINHKPQSAFELLKLFIEDLNENKDNNGVKPKLLKILIEDYFYSQESAEDFLDIFFELELQFQNAILNSTPEKFENIEVKTYDVNKLLAMDYKLPDCYRILSMLKNNYKEIEKKLKRNERLL